MSGGYDRFGLDLVRARPGWLLVGDGEVALDLPERFTEPWRVPAAAVGLIEWWSRTRAVFRAPIGEPAIRPYPYGAVRLEMRALRDFDLALWFREAQVMPLRPVRGLLSPIELVAGAYEQRGDEPLPGSSAVNGVWLGILGDRIEVKRAFERRWGAPFPKFGSPG